MEFPDQSSPASRLPDVRGPRVPGGYRPGVQWVARLQGLGLALLGLLGLGLAVALFVPTVPLPAPSPLPRAPLAVPVLAPVLVLGSIGLVVVGLSRVLRP